ncbi:DNA-binding response regulator [Anaerobacillus alkalidiazotrophicus]|uniref:DNA-binding response regulator n=1 Tax=Anaerobacillus alkalidiazotrophicus TaxID=472963 RepID=A0A1S2MCQ0_9BACI|nr:response regulator transcription factor [Anaerobacillus alkalidiazotrophicus]OIJ21445.1 DNA-binding response regulator [Anaerobacillus alkalidiazotrophicus]
MKKLTLLVVDDDPNICELIRLYCEKEGYVVKIAYSGTEGLNTFYDDSFDLIILDIMLPGLDGWELCKEIRSSFKTPIIMLTGKGESYDIIKGLDLGADDYVIKPFDPKELIARVKAVLRRYNVLNSEQEILSFPTLVIDMKQYKVRSYEEEITLPPKEIELLFFLAANANRVFTRQQLLDQIWGYDFEGDPRTVDVHIKRIREKLGKEAIDWELKTLRGIGYKFEVKAQ